MTAANARRLNTTQLLTLYLALHRDPPSRKGSPWAKYLATLPESFAPWHPLTWYYRPGYDGWWQRVLGILPVPARSKLEDVQRRYEEDAEVLRDTLVSHRFVTQANCERKMTDRDGRQLTNPLSREHCIRTRSRMIPFFGPG